MKSQSNALSAAWSKGKRFAGDNSVTSTSPCNIGNKRLLCWWYPHKEWEQRGPLSISRESTDHSPDFSRPKHTPMALQYIQVWYALLCGRAVSPGTMKLVCSKLRSFYWEKTQLHRTRETGREYPSSPTCIVHPVNYFSRAFSLLICVQILGWSESCVFVRTSIEPENRQPL